MVKLSITKRNNKKMNSNGGSSMRIRYVLVLSMALKVGMVVMGMILLVSKMWGAAEYFSVTATPAEQRQSVREAEDRDQVNDLGMTGLMFAAVNGQVDLAKALMEYGADLNKRSNDEQQTALHYATNNMRSLGSQAVGYELVDGGANTMLKNRFGQVPLHMVISTDTMDDRTKMVEYLLKNGSYMNAQTGQGDTLMHLAVNLKNVDWIETLLNKWASIIDLNIRNKKGWTPYEYAVQLGFDTVQDLLQKQYPKVTNAIDRDTNGLTGLMLAIMRLDQKAVEAMTRDARAINLTSTDRYGNSALHVALLHQNVPAVIALLNAGANVMLKNALGELPAQELVRVADIQKKLRLAPLVLNKNRGAITTKNNKGNTLVHVVVQYNDVPLMKYLVANYKPEVQTAMEIKNNALESPRQLASKLHRPEMGDLLDSISTIRGKSSKAATPA